MTRINTNVSAMVARTNLERTNTDLATRLQRLSTGLKINRGADDPAGLIVSERLRGEISSIGQAVDNIERASNVIATTESALQEINDLLISIKALAVESANTGAFSKEEIEANQLQLDSAVESITRISNTASFAGLKLLNGSLDYLTSGVTASQISDVSIKGANFGLNASIPVSVEVLQSAENASLFLSGNGTGTFTSAVSFEVQGNNGVQVFTFASGTALSAVVTAINQVSDATGVEATLASAANPTSGVILQSAGFGSSEFVSVRKLSGGAFFDAYTAQGGGAVNRDIGGDTLALINGNLAIGDGLDISLNASTLNVEMTLTSGAAQTLNTPFTYAITGGGATYQIGPDINSLQQVGFGIQSVAATRLGNSTVGFLNEVLTGEADSLLNDPRGASEIIDAAIDQVSTLRGRIGAFERNTLDTTLRSQQVALENLTSAESVIRDTDFAEETSNLTRAQILQQAGTQTLAIANNTAQSVLSLLG
ncbi:MAG: flagellin [Planctomycetota bacterium]